MQEHIIERDAGSGAGAWALVAVLVVILALILFGSNFLRGRDNPQQTDINIRGNIETPSSPSTGTTSPSPSTPTQ